VKYVEEGYAVCAMDMVGHGFSDGLHTFVPNIEDMIDDTTGFFLHCQDHMSSDYPEANLNFFLEGISMGGAIAHLTHQRLEKTNLNFVRGCVFTAPMVCLILLFC